MTCARSFLLLNRSISRSLLTLCGWQSKEKGILEFLVRLGADVNTDLSTSLDKMDRDLQHAVCELYTVSSPKTLNPKP